MVDKNYMPDNVFTYNVGKNALQIVTPLTVYNHLNCRSRVVNALWDTGAFQSHVSERVVAELGLEEVSEMGAVTANGNVKRKTTLCFTLPGDCDYMAFVEAAILPYAIGSSEFVIGLDIITMGDFSLSRKKEETILTFTFNKDIFITREDDKMAMLHKMAVFKKMIMDRKNKSLGIE